jgi:hypothetical protein
LFAKSWLAVGKLPARSFFEILCFVAPSAARETGTEVPALRVSPYDESGCGWPFRTGEFRNVSLV